MSAAPSTLLVSGCQRTGTTLLSQILSSHPLIYVPNEEGIVQQALSLWHSIRAGEKAKENSWYAPIFGKAKMELPSRLRWADIVVRAYLQAWREYCGPNWQYIGDKYPGYIPDHYENLTHWLDCRWILMSREKAPTLSSMEKAPWNAGRTKESMEMEYDSVSRFLANVSEDKGRCLVIPYEELCASPKEVCNRLAAFLGVDNLFNTALVRPPAQVNL